jgi:hypothetical protein
MKDNILEIVKKECPLYNFSHKAQKYKNGVAVKKNDKYVTELQRDWCTMGFVCFYFKGKTCPSFNDSIIKEYIDMKNKKDERDEIKKNKR